MNADELETLIDRLANSLLLAVRLEADLKQSARDAADLLASGSRTSEALREFRHSSGEP